MIDDATLLRRYATDRSETAFAELAARHLPLVYSAALRRLDGDAHGAADVAQVVFATLARDAAGLSRHPVLTGWLYTATRNAAIDLMRAGKRRHRREQEAQALQLGGEDPNASLDWAGLRPVIDGAMDQLPGNDREAVLLRFFQGRAFADIGSALGLSEDAARKRVERAVGRLEGLLRRRGITSSSAALAAMLASQTALAAPAGVLPAVVGSAMTAGGFAISALTFMTMTKLQIVLVAAVVAGAVGLISEHRTIDQLRETTASLQQQLERAARANAALGEARVKADSALAKVLSGTASDPSRPASTSLGAIGRRPVVDDAARLREKEREHHEYDPFFQRRGLTPEQADRVVELMVEQSEARADLQAGVVAAGATGGTEGVEELRAQLYAPILNEMRAILGEDGYVAYNAYQRDYYYHAFTDPVTTMLASANAPLSDAQAALFRRVVEANDHPQQAKSTDIGSQSRIDWNSVMALEAGALSPAQISVIRAYGERQKSAAAAPSN